MMKLVLTTTGSREEARRIARTLVDLRTGAGGKALASESWLAELRASETERRQAAYSGSELLVNCAK